MNIVSPILEAGIPRIDDYKQLIETPLFRDMEAFSNSFLKKNAFLHDHYRWVKDPLHQWSRQWEYPYVYRSVREYLYTRRIRHSPAMILDAGSGITFFPYYLKSTVRDLDITCCDSDGALAPLFDQVNRSVETGGEVKFIEADMHTLPFKDDSMDVIYCISVLEHTRCYSLILDDFRRILRPGGCLVLTFDIGLDGVSDIAPESAHALLEEIDRKFTYVHDRRDIEIGASGNLSSRYATRLDHRLAPWRFPRLSLTKAALRARRVPTSLHKNLTVYCNTFIKPGPSSG